MNYTYKRALSASNLFRRLQKAKPPYLVFGRVISIRSTLCRQLKQRLCVNERVYMCVYVSVCKAEANFKSFQTQKTYSRCMINENNMQSKIDS